MACRGYQLPRSAGVTSRQSRHPDCGLGIVAVPHPSKVMTPVRPRQPAPASCAAPYPCYVLGVIPERKLRVRRVATPLRCVTGIAEIPWPQDKRAFHSSGPWPASDGGGAIRPPPHADRHPTRPIDVLCILREYQRIGRGMVQRPGAECSICPTSTSCGPNIMKCLASS